MTEPVSEQTPISRERLGDTGPWTWHLPALWRALADPDGPWDPPA